MGEKVMFLYLLIVMIICRGCNGAKVYKVGGSSGWTNTNISPSHYKSWASSKVFHVGDTILFEYNKEFHNVVRVTHENFNNCNSTAPYAHWVTGNDSFTITRPGHYYFMCSLPGHCWAGQKVDIRVLHHNSHKGGPSPSPSPQSPSEPGPSPPRASPSYLPGPSPVAVPRAQPHKSGSTCVHSSLKLWLLIVAIALPRIAS